MALSVYQAKTVRHKAGLKTRLREQFACVKAVLDVTLRTQPKLLGPKLEIGSTGI